MPFLLYETEYRGEKVRFNQMEHGGGLVSRTIKLAGKTGVLAELSLLKNANAQIPFGWHVGESEIITHMKESPRNKAIVIDLKPNVDKNVSLYRLRDVWGFSYEDWTPLALLLESLFVDREETEPAAFKKKFDINSRTCRLVAEFLYVKGGVVKGTWNWGLAGRVNGALLWPDSWAFLVNSVQAKMIASGMQTGQRNTADTYSIDSN